MTQNQLSLESVDLRDKEKELKDLLKNRLLNIWYDFSKVQITYLWDDVFAIWYENRIWFFCNSEWNNYFNLKSLSINYFFEKASILAWYKEIKRKDGIYEMYKIKEINKKWDKIDTKLWEKLDKYSLENFQAWQNIDFFENLLLIKTICIADWNLESTNLKLLSILSKSW